MNLNTLKAFRHGVYQSFLRAKDALFNLVDTLASEERAQSLPELSLSPAFERKFAIRNHRIVGSRLRLDVVVVPLESLAHPRLPDPFEKQSLFLPTRASTNRQTWRSSQTWGEVAAQ